MRTTVDLPDDLARAVKVRAVEENRNLKDTIADLLRRGLVRSEERSPKVRRRLKLPLVDCAHDARPSEEMTPERVSEVLLDEEAAPHRAALR
jgi:plasmid stability protein